MLQLEAEGELDRLVEFLPTSDEMAERRGRGVGLTWPEIALLVAYSKRSIKRDLLEADLPDAEYLEQDLARYFPETIVDRFRPMLAEHPLRRVDRDDRLERRRELPGGHVRVAARRGDRGDPGRGRARSGSPATSWARCRDGTRWSHSTARSTRRWNDLMIGVDRLVESTARWYLVRAPGSASARPSIRRGPPSVSCPR